MSQPLYPGWSIEAAEQWGGGRLFPRAPTRARRRRAVIECELGLCEIGAGQRHRAANLEEWSRGRLEMNTANL